MDKKLLQPGNILIFRDKERKPIFRSYICNLIGVNFLETIGVLQRTSNITLWKHITPFTPFISKQLSPYRKPTTAIVLIHGIDFTYIYFPKVDIRYINLFAKHRIKKIHTTLYSYIPNSQIYHFYYPSATTSIQYSSKYLTYLLEEITKKDNIRSIYLIGYSMGGIVAKGIFLHNLLIKEYIKGIYTIDTPHLGTPLVSLLSNPFYEQQSIQIISTIIKRFYQLGLIMVPAYLLLSWYEKPIWAHNIQDRTLQQINNISFPTYIFTIGSVGTMKYHDIKIKNLLTTLANKHIEDLPLSLLAYVSGFILQFLGKHFKREVFLQHDGVVPLISQQPPLKNHIPLHTFKSNHIEITTLKEVWHLIGNHIKNGGN